MATKVQRLGKNSAANVLRLVAEMSEKIALPAGVILRTEAEMVLWEQLTHTRAREGWRDFDLWNVAKVARLEADIRKYQQALDFDGAVVTNERGTPIVNPLLTVVDSLQRQQLAIVRSLSLNQTSQDPRTLNSQGKEQSRMRGAINSFDDLIAR
jgi:hypothetical protein